LKFSPEKNFEDPDKLLQLADYLNDPNIQIAFDSVQQRFANLDQLEQNLTELLKHYKYHYPKAGTPDIYTYISGFYFEQPVIIMDNSIIIALDFSQSFCTIRQIGHAKIHATPLYSRAHSIGNSPGSFDHAFSARYAIRQLAAKYDRSRQKPVFH
jgi:hypothetical protein